MGERMMNGNLVHKQKGLTMISWLVVIAFIFFQGMIAFKLGPVYLNDATVKSVLEDLEADPAMVGASPKKISEAFFKRLKINNIYDLLDKSHVKVKKSRYHYVFTVTYEPRGTIVGSWDYIMTFKHEAKIRIK